MTTQTEQNEDKLLQTTRTPDIDRLVTEFQQAGGYIGRQWRADYADKARFTRWPGQHPSGRKKRELLGDACLPWDNAADTRQPLVDGIIRDLSAVLTTAGARAGEGHSRQRRQRGQGAAGGQTGEPLPPAASARAGP